MFTLRQAVEFLVQRGYHISRTGCQYTVESTAIGIGTGMPLVDLTVDGSGLADFAVSVCQGEHDGSIV